MTAYLNPYLQYTHGANVAWIALYWLILQITVNPPFGQPWGGKDAGDGVEKAVRDEYKKGQYGRFGAGLPATGDMQLLFMQHAIAKMDEHMGRAAIITNGSPLFSGNTTSGESQIRRSMLERDLIEAIIALPSQLFYNTDIGIYAFILSKNKDARRKNKVQLIDATDMWEPLKRSLGKKRREISKAQIAAITKAYADFAEGTVFYASDRRKEGGTAHQCKVETRIFDRNTFLYKEYAVYQPLQRSAAIDAQSIENLRTSAYFTANAAIFNEADFEELQETDPRDAKAEKTYQKYQSDRIYNDYAEFEAQLKILLSDIEGYSASRLTGIAMAMSKMDKSAKVQRDKKGAVIVDPGTKDIEIISLDRDPEAYMRREVLPYVPDAIWRYEYDPQKPESATNKEKLGAEFPFTRFFYEYREPEKSDDLLAEFMRIEKGLAAKIAALNGEA